MGQVLTMERALWVVALAAAVALVFYAMRRGWVNRGQRQAVGLPAFPEPPELGTELLPAATGFYVGTTFAGSWQDRVVVGDIGHRASATARLGRPGLRLDRDGASPLWIPAESLRAVRIDNKLANKVLPGSGMLVVTWQLGERELDTGFRCDDKTTQQKWVDAVRALLPATGDVATQEGK